jgi:hypothetical protein
VWRPHSGRRMAAGWQQRQRPAGEHTRMRVSQGIVCRGPVFGISGARIFNQARRPQTESPLAIGEWALLNVCSDPGSAAESNLSGVRRRHHVRRHRIHPAQLRRRIRHGLRRRIHHELPVLPRGLRQRNRVRRIHVPRNRAPRIRARQSHARIRDRSRNRARIQSRDPNPSPTRGLRRGRRRRRTSPGRNSHRAHKHRGSTSNSPIRRPGDRSPLERQPLRGQFQPRQLLEHLLPLPRTAEPGALQTEPGEIPS